MEEHRNSKSKKNRDTVNRSAHQDWNINQSKQKTRINNTFPMIISVDIGSTWTKAAVFVLEDDTLKVVSRSSVPTTVQDLTLGFTEVLSNLEMEDNESFLRVPVVCSSSAKGGLSIAAVGIVPDLTLKMAHQTALSAGARIQRVFSYELTSLDVKKIEELHPDIILFTGGTDGGNREFIEKNTRALKQLSIRPHILFAGNRSMGDYVKQELSEFQVVITENILPELQRPNPEPARRAIRKLFIETITRGKGLETVAQRCTGPILPTPLAVYELVQTISLNELEWGSFCLVDMGGATTDVYSSGGAIGAISGTTDINDWQRVYKGIQEFPIGRTVEGDLGMRVSSAAAWEARNSYFREIVGSFSFQSENQDSNKTNSGTKQEKISHDGGQGDGGQTSENADTIRDFENYLAGLPQRSDYLPVDPIHKNWDLILAAGCLTGAMERHAGRIRRVFTPQGEVWVQSGRDLQGMKKLVFSGGFLSQVNLEKMKPLLQYQKTDESGQGILLPKEWELFQDQNYIIPLLANCQRFYPKETARTAVQAFDKLCMKEKQ